MVTAIIPTWNRADLLADILRDVRAQTTAVTRTIVVDNGSTDGSESVARKAGAEVIRWSENRGFARAVNAGVRAAATEWVLILNNDVRLPSEWLAGLLDEVRGHPEAGFFVSKLTQDRDAGILDGTFDALSRSGFAWRCGAGRRDGPLWSEARQIQFAPLTAALIRRDLFDEVGFLEERFESYYEDVEFFLRCGLRGVTGRYTPTLAARHMGSATLGEWNRDTVYRLTRNQRYLVRIYFHELPRKPVVVGQLLWMLLCFRHGKAIACLRGWLAGGATLEIRRESVARARITRIVDDGDETIKRLQQATEFDWFWKTYFRWAG